MMQLEGTTALLTGASRGIGPVVAEALARRRVHLILTARRLDALARTMDALVRHDVRLTPLEADLSTAEGVDSLVREATEKAPPIDVLVNNAGMAAMLPYERIRPDEIARELYVNLGAPLALTRLLLPGMLARGKGHIVNMSSLAGEVALPYEAIYGATKAGLVLASRALRMEYRGTGVSVSVILPGVVRGAGMAENFEKKTGIGFPWFMGGCTPEQVAKGVIGAIERDRAEVIVNRPPMRWTLALLRLVPGLWDFLVHRALRKTSSRAAHANLEAGGGYTDVAVSPSPEVETRERRGAS